jgi:hypothetical protein
MATTVENLPGIRAGARAYLFLQAHEEGIATRIEDFGADWIALAAPTAQEMKSPLALDAPMEVEVPLSNGSLYLVGKHVARRDDRLPMLVMRVEEVGADPQVPLSKETRQHFRHGLWLPVRQLAFRQPHSDIWQETNGVMRNMSAGGASIIAEMPVSLGATVLLTCPVPLDPVGLVVYGTVVGGHQGGTARRPRCIVNIRFDSLSAADQSWLGHQLHRYQWYSRARRR